MIKALLGFLRYLFLASALLFAAAGPVNGPMAWVYAVLLLASTLGSRAIVLARSPDTLRERARLASFEGVPAWDRVLVPIVGFYEPMATMVVAGLDHGWGWSPAMPLAGQFAAALLVAAGYCLAEWAMVENRYFSSIVRILAVRGQQVVTTGPYRLARHPSYTGAILASLALPFILSALWSLIPAVAMAAPVAVRTGLEDQMLRAKLAGYQN